LRAVSELPEMARVWKVSDSVRERFPWGRPVIVEFRPVLVHCYSTFGSYPLQNWKKPSELDIPTGRPPFRGLTALEPDVYRE
jgi:hypothetical protein